jgi:sensor domain CHASE-containing protein
MKLINLSTCPVYNAYLFAGVSIHSIQHPSLSISDLVHGAKALLYNFDGMQILAIMPDVAVSTKKKYANKHFLLRDKEERKL